MELNGGVIADYAARVIWRRAVAFQRQWTSSAPKSEKDPARAEVRYRTDGSVQSSGRGGSLRIRDGRYSRARGGYWAEGGRTSAGISLMGPGHFSIPIHVRSFRGRPERPIRDSVLRGDIQAANAHSQDIPSRD